MQNRGRNNLQVERLMVGQGRKKILEKGEREVKIMENIIENIDENTDEEHIIKQLQRMIEIAEKKIEEILNKRLRQEDRSQNQQPKTMGKRDDYEHSQEMQQCL